MLELQLADVLEGDTPTPTYWVSVHPGFIVMLEPATDQDDNPDKYTVVTLNKLDVDPLYVCGARLAVRDAAMFALASGRATLVGPVDRFQPMPEGCDAGAATPEEWRAVDARITKALSYPSNAMFAQDYPDALRKAQAAEAAAKDRDANAGKGDEQETPRRNRPPTGHNVRTMELVEADRPE